jgi:hypothetical protein
MILLTKGETQEIVLSLNEKVAIANPVFYFVFENDMTNESIAMVLTDTSSYKARYNSFTLNTNTYFLNAKNGYWTYKVYGLSLPEWNNITTAWNLLTDVTWNLLDNDELLEVGKMKLVGDAFEFIQYETLENNYIIYN